MSATLSSDIAAGATVGALLAVATARLAAVGIAEPRREARLVLALALGIEPSAVLGWPERAVAAEVAASVGRLVERRAGHEPLSRLAGKREFWSLDFALAPETLDPRPDSETLIASALDDIAERDAALRVVDFGTGSGCLLLALLSELPQARGIGVDIAPGAVTAAQGNAARLGLDARATFQRGSWESQIDGPADVILANPPYIPTSEIARLPPEVLGFDPLLALDGGVDGLSAYRALGPAIRTLLKPPGRAYIEIGDGQAGQVTRIFVESRLRVAGVKRDLAGAERCVVATL